MKKRILFERIDIEKPIVDKLREDARAAMPIDQSLRFEAMLDELAGKSPLARRAAMPPAVLPPITIDRPLRRHPPKGKPPATKLRQRRLL
jgi:hypothetical protein